VTEPRPRHNADYLARDYDSLRALLLHHLQALAPDSAALPPASLETTLVEALAYVGDYLSYYQDAVATEAYLATARQRISLRRHARLVDHSVDEGCSARVWASIQVSAERVPLAAGTALLTGLAGAARTPRLPAGSEWEEAGCVTFETIHDAVLSRAHNGMAAADGARPLQPGDREILLAGALPGLARGDVLVLRNPRSAWAQAVRLVSAAVEEGGTRVVWHEEDSLPADLPSGGGWEILGNIVLADQGRSCAMHLPRPAREGRVELDIGCPELAFTMPYRHSEALLLPAAAVHQGDPRRAEPAMRLIEEAGFLPPAALARREPWTGRRDLLHASQFERVFAAEPDGDGGVRLRFGDGVHGRRLPAEWDYVLHYRQGSGARGNIGPNTLAHIVGDDDRLLGVSNPLPAQGGTDPDPLGRIRAQAPLAGDVQRRCVTDEDYARMTCRFPGVRSAWAQRTWSAQGSPVTIHVCRSSDRAWGDEFQDRLSAWLDAFKLIGDTPLRIVGAAYVTPHVVLSLETVPGQAPEPIADAVRARLSALTFDFGEPLDPARLVAVARQVRGVTAARVVGLARDGARASSPAPVEVEGAEVIRLEPANLDIVAVRAR
jgi:hypothetical protein